jgi:hypothetical protein
MQNRTLPSCLSACALGVLIATASSSAHAAGSAPPAAEKVLLKMIEAVKAESYDAFLADADASMKKQLSHQQFEGICGMYAKALKKGYTLEYFGQLKQRGMTIYVWKVSSPGAKEDVLVKLGMKDGKASTVQVQ